MSNFVELENSDHNKLFDGTGKFENAFQMVDHSVYDLSVQEPVQNRMNYQQPHPDGATEYDLPPDSEY